MCQCLLKKGALLSEVDSEGRGVLHWAAISGQVTIWTQLKPARPYFLSPPGVVCGVCAAL